MPKTPRVALFVTCLVDLHRPTVGFAAIRLLERAGCTVEVPPHANLLRPARLQHRRPRHRPARSPPKSLPPSNPTTTSSPPSGSCGGMIAHHYPALFDGDPAWRARAEALAGRSHELVAFLTDIMGVKSVDTAFSRAVTYHDSCSGLRELGVHDQPRALLQTIPGLTLREMADPDVCCGFGGTFCVKYPDISARMVSNKTADITATGADVLLAGDLGCLLNMADRLSREGSRVEVRHVAEVLGRHDRRRAADRAQRIGAGHHGRSALLGRV